MHNMDYRLKGHSVECCNSFGMLHAAQIQKLCVTNGRNPCVTDQRFWLEPDQGFWLAPLHHGPQGFGLISDQGFWLESARHWPQGIWLQSVRGFRLESEHRGPQGLCPESDQGFWLESVRHGPQESSARIRGKQWPLSINMGNKFPVGFKNLGGFCDFGDIDENLQKTNK